MDKALLKCLKKVILINETCVLPITNKNNKQGATGMAFFDKLKAATESAVSAASNAAQKAKDTYETNKQAREEQKAAEEAYKAEMNEKANTHADELVYSIVENGKENERGFFSINSSETILKFTKDFFEKILLPANSVSKSYISMYPHMDDKKIKNINKVFAGFIQSETMLMHIIDTESQEFVLTYETFYFKVVLPEDKKFFAIGQIPIMNISQFSLVKENDCYSFMCDTVKLANLMIMNNREEDFITLNNYFSSIIKQDFDITDVEIDNIIQEKIGSKIYQQIKKYMIYDDELAIYFAWGLDSITAKDYIVCTTKQIIIMDREIFGATANVKQIYYEDITSAQTIQNSGDNSLTGMLIDTALTSLFKQCDLQISVSGAITKISTLNKIEAERVIAIYHEYRKMIKTSSAQPQVVVQQNQPDVLDQIEKLAKLKDAGILTEDEFNQKKVELLSKL